ncbi:DExH-box splicing factor binding site-domain-containing protein [Aspergillus aurantiobrunneus]
MSSNPPQDGSERSPGASTKPVSLSLGPSKSQNKKTAFNFQSSSRNTDSPSSQTLARRPHHNLHHDDDDYDDNGVGEPAFESVTGFDMLTGNTIGDGEEKKPLTIPVASGNNWRDRPGVIRRPKGKKNLLPKEVQALQETQKKGKVREDNGDAVGPSMSYGLSFAEQKPTGEEGGQTTGEGDQKMEDAAPLAVEDAKPLTEDEIALRALFRESKGEVEGRSDLVIESKRAEEEEEEEELYDGHNNETRTYRKDVASRPDPATLDQYNAIPVEEFGAALLRGMGWKEGHAVGKGNYSGGDPSRASTAHVPARRPGFLGIGAKDVSGGKAEVEFGAWGKAAMRKGSRKAGEAKEGERNTEGVYMPVLMRNKKTGETITEEELSVMTKEAKKRDNDDWKERRDRNLERDGRDKDRHRDRDSRRLEYPDDDRYESRRNGSSRRDRTTGETIDIIVTVTVTASIVLTVIEIGIGIVIEEAENTTMMTGIAPGIHRLMRLAGTGIGTGIEIVIANLIGGEDTMIDEHKSRDVDPEWSWLY